MKSPERMNSTSGLARPASVVAPSVPFDRIEASYPNPVELNDAECATLEAWLKAHRRRMRMSEQYRASRGDSAVKAKLDAEDAWWNHVRFVAAYNQRLRQSPRQSTPFQSTPFTQLRERVMRLTHDPAIADKRAMHVLKSLKAVAARLYCQHAEAGTPGFQRALCRFRRSEDSKTLVAGPVSVGNHQIGCQVPIPRDSFERDRPYLGLWNGIQRELSLRFPQRIRNPDTAGVTDKLTRDGAAFSVRVIAFPPSEWRQWAEDFAACMSLLAELAGETDCAQALHRGEGPSRKAEEQLCDPALLTREACNVLAALAKRPKQAMPLADIVTNAGHSKNTTRNALSVLEALGYVARPAGTQRKGYAITDRGLSYYEAHIMRA